MVGVRVIVDGGVFVLVAALVAVDVRVGLGSGVFVLDAMAVDVTVRKTVEVAVGLAGLSGAIFVPLARLAKSFAA